jgi:2,3-bisphosphoglycerate-dependent phosphoglycerate mutase
MTALTRFIVIRHGETEWNVAARIQGQGDSALTAAGVAQARALARRLATQEFDILVASDLGRALDTARHVGVACGHAVRLDARFRERNFGAGEGMTYEEIDRAYPDAFSRVREVDPDYVIPGGESRRQLHERVRAGFEALAAEHPGKTIVVVTHGGVLATFYRHVNGIELRTPHRIPITNASCNLLAFDGERWTIETWSDTAHLEGAEPFEEA